MKRAVLVLALLAAAATPAPARALLLSDQLPATCAQSDEIVHMPCANVPVQLETVRNALVRSFVPMNCRATGVRFELGGFPVSAGRGAGLIAAAIVRPSWHRVQVQQMCRPSHW